VIRKEIESRTTNREKVLIDDPLPISNECKRILANTGDEADRLNHLHIGTEHLLLAILGEERCFAAEVLHERGLRLNAIRDTLARSTMSMERGVRFLPQEMASRRELPESGLVPDADTAKRIAEAVWIPQYGADTVANQAPFEAELKINMWIVTGSSSAEAPLFAFILQRDGRIVSVGQGSMKR